MLRIVWISESSSLGSQPKLVRFLSNLSITVLSVHCGRTHTLLYTNNGVRNKGIYEVFDDFIDKFR